MSFSNEYKAGYSGNYNPNVDTLSYSYQMGQNDRSRQMLDGTYGNAGGGGAGGGGAVLGVFAVIIAFCAFAIALMSYPVASGITGIAFAIGTSIFNGSGPQMNFFGLVFGLMVPCYIVFILSFNLEKKLGQYRPYRIFRQIWRMVIGTFFAYTLCTGLYSEGSNPGFFEYAIATIATVSSPFLMYLNSVRLDKKYELEPIRFRWLEMIMAPVKDRFVARVDETTRDTPLFHAKDALHGGTMDVQISNGTAKLGDMTIPIRNIKSVTFDRDKRGLLIAAGVILPVLLITFIGKSGDEEFRGFFQQLFGVLSLAGGALLILWGAIPSFPAGRLQGPFRNVNVSFAKSESENGQVYLKFARPEEERMFIQAIENGLKAMPRAENPPALVAEKRKPEGGRFRRLVPFKF